MAYLDLFSMRNPLVTSEMLYLINKVFTRALNEHFGSFWAFLYFYMQLIEVISIKMIVYCGSLGLITIWFDKNHIMKQNIVFGPHIEHNNWTNCQFLIISLIYVAWINWNVHVHVIIKKLKSSNAFQYFFFLSALSQWHIILLKP